MDQRRGVERVPGPLAREPGDGEPSEFLVDLGEKALGRRRHAFDSLGAVSDRL